MAQALEQLAWNQQPGVGQAREMLDTMLGVPSEREVRLATFEREKRREERETATRREARLALIFSGLSALAALTLALVAIF